MSDEEQHVDDPIADGLDYQEIGSPDPSEFVGQECPPGLAAAGCWFRPAITTDGALADDDSQFQELTSYALTAPQRIVTGHICNEVANLRAQARPPQPGPRLPSPVQAPTLAMPPEHGFRFHTMWM